MESDKTKSKRKMFFNIKPSNGGVTSQLLQFTALYKLGLSLGYCYVHQPFYSPRSSDIRADQWPASMPEQWWRDVVVRWKQFESRFHPGVYDFIGFNEYLSAKTERYDCSNIKPIILQIGDSLTDANNVSTFESLQRYVADFVNERVGRQKKSMVTFSLLPGSGRNFFGLINDTIPDFQDGLNLREVYFEARRKQPWPNKYPVGRLKVAVHIRQGDTAVVKTPWDTYILAWNKSDGKFKYVEAADLNTFAKVPLLPVDDYHEFVQQLTARFAADDFSFLFLSDGFQRAFERVSKKVEKLDLTDTQIAVLKRSQKSYDKRAFAKFDDINNSAAIVGEHPTKLCDLLHSVLLADIVIVGTQQKLVPKFLSNYSDPDTMPILIVLYRAGKPKHHTLGLNEVRHKFIYVDMNQPDYDAIALRLSELLGDRLNVKSQLSASHVLAS
ncbi:MAG: hypothetical protein ACPGWR_01535 [Ardenticatenaceae bacterium]